MIKYAKKIQIEEEKLATLVDCEESDQYGEYKEKFVGHHFLNYVSSNIIFLLERLDWKLFYRRN